MLSHCQHQATLNYYSICTAHGLTESQFCQAAPCPFQRAERCNPPPHLAVYKYHDDLHRTGRSGANSTAEMVRSPRAETHSLRPNR